MSFSLISLSSSSSSIVSRTFPSFFSSETSSPPSSLLTLLRNQSNFSHVASIYRNFGSSSCSFVSSGCSMSVADYVVPRAFSSSFESEFSASGRNSDGESSEVGSGENDEQGAETDDEDQVLIVDEEDVGYSNSDLPQRWDVLGLGQAMVDFSGMVDNEFLERLGLEKGTRKVVNHEERGKVLSAMDGCSYKAAAGGSLSNSLVALARLGGQSIAGPALNVALAGSIGSDPLGGFYRSKLRRANVNFLSAPVKDGTTGTVIVLTTSDAQRTMLAYQVQTVSNLQKGYITNHENLPTHHHMKHGNWWYSHLLEDLQLRSNHKTWQHKEDRLVLVRNTYKEKRRQRLSTSQPSFRNYLA